MSAVARELIALVRTAGGSFRVLDGRVRVEAPTPLSSELIDSLRAGKDEVLALLVLGRSGSSILADTAMADEIEERAAHLEYDAGLPRSWAEPFARILCREAPGDFDETQWRRVLDSAMIFADAWAAKALALGWVAEDMFALRPTAPTARHDMKGLAWLLANGARVVAINADSADIVTAAGSKQRFYRRGTARDG
jgi:hypothetical protein